MGLESGRPSRDYPGLFGHQWQLGTKPVTSLKSLGWMANFKTKLGALSRISQCSCRGRLPHFNLVSAGQFEFGSGAPMGKRRPGVATRLSRQACFTRAIGARGS